MNETGLHPVVDKSIILNIAGGDKSALSELYSRTKNAVFCFALSILRDREAAQDVMQDTYIQVWKSASNYKPSQKDPLPWILGIAKYLAYAELRSRKNLTEINEDAPEPQDPKNCFDECENKLFANALLSTLKEDEREIVVLHIMAELKHREIAELLGLPLSTVLNKYSRAIKKLGRSVGDAI